MRAFPFAVASLLAVTVVFASPPTLGLTPIAALGEQLFKDESLSVSGRLACQTCHQPEFAHAAPSNVGLPGNAYIPANADPDFHDLGLCGPERKDLAARRDLCGAFKVPTLRNVARTAPYFHNGAFETLREAVDFYVRRDTHPGDWFPKTAAGVRKFDDLPPGLAGSVNTAEVPYARKEGGRPALTPAEIDDVVAFLATLDDGYN